MSRKLLIPVIVAVAVFVQSPMAAAEQNMFFNLGFGGADAGYGQEVDTLLDLLADTPGVDHVAISIDLGLYFRVNDKSMLGAALSGIGDRFEAGADFMQVNQYLYALSYRFYPSGSLGRGFFLRGDIGLAKMGVEDNSSSQVSETGSGLLLGAGYAFQISGGTWFSLNADYSTKTIEDETVTGATIGFAFLF